MIYHMELQFSKYITCIQKDTILFRYYITFQKPPWHSGYVIHFVNQSQRFVPELLVSVR